MIKIFFSLLFLVINDAVLGLQHYTFSDSANGWFKLHQVPAKWQDAYTTCNTEGAVLASPLNENIINHLRVHMLLNKVDRPIHLGVNALRSAGDFVSLEGVPLDDMPVIWGSYGDGTKPEDCLTFTSDGKVYTSSCTEYLPYFCYKKKANEIMNECGTFDDKYKLNATTGSCYKLHTETKTWTEAQKICLAEAGHLVVLNNREEAEIIVDLFSEQMMYGGVYRVSHVGLLVWNNDFNWVTITGEQIDDVYNEWARNNPDQNRGLCVCLLSDVTLENIRCSEAEMGFVCEKNPNTIQFE